MLTARDEEPDRVVGLEVGADDYLTKPFSPRELVARMKAILRRTDPQPDQEVLALGDVVLNRETHDVTIGGELVELTAKEFELLAYFLVESRTPSSRATSCSTGSGASSIPAARARSTCTSRSCAASSAGPA